MMSFVLMAVAALVIDVGFAVVARRQMQTATDTAAIEGLKWRDAGRPGVADQQRRTNAGLLLQMVFLDTDSPYAGPRNFGAGPVLTFSDENAVDLGDGFMASETLHVPTTPPTPQINGGIQSLPSDPRWPFRINGFDQGDSATTSRATWSAGRIPPLPRTPRISPSGTRKIRTTTAHPQAFCWKSQPRVPARHQSALDDDAGRQCVPGADEAVE